MPAREAGVLVQLTVREGATVSKGDVIATHERRAVGQGSLL
ncbi:MAG: biotin/lipoyl-binding protein [Planctomycetia bacterium]|nr:biotin/lipoyl-binding protein [Planctomycetia bacterium]